MSTAINGDLAMAMAGGLLIGVAALTLMALLGRVAGISGITWAALTAKPRENWRWLFLAGLPLGAALAHGIIGVPLPQGSSLSPTVAILAGLLVGLGVRLGNGCTSGHGVCGIGLLSPRSIIATLTFMTAGVVTVLMTRHLVPGVLGAMS